MTKEIIRRKDGIVYERKKRENVCDTYLNLRVTSDLVESLKKIALNKGVKKDSLIKEILNEYVNKEENK